MGCMNSHWICENNYLSPCTISKKPGHTDLKAAINDSYEGAGDVKAPLNLGDGALHVGTTEGFGEIDEGHGGQEELEGTCKSLLGEVLLDRKCLFTLQYIYPVHKHLVDPGLCVSPGLTISACNLKSWVYIHSTKCHT